MFTLDRVRYLYILNSFGLSAYQLESEVPKGDPSVGTFIEHIEGDEKKAPVTQEQVRQDHSATVSSALPAESTVSTCQRLVDELLSQAMLGFLLPRRLRDFELLAF